MTEHITKGRLFHRIGNEIHQDLLLIVCMLVRNESEGSRLIMRNGSGSLILERLSG